MNTVFIASDGKKGYESSRVFALVCLDFYLKENNIDAEYDFFYKESGEPAFRRIISNGIKRNSGEVCELFVSISHSKDYLVVAIGSEKIGIDVEVIRDIKYKGIAEKFFSKAQCKDVAENGLRRFFEYWVRYEAAHKREGIGIFAGKNIGADSAGLIDVNDEICLAVACEKQCSLRFI